MQVQDIVAILVVLLTVWGGISKAIDRAAKKRRQEEMARQKDRAASGEGVATQPVPVPMRSGRAIEQPRRADDLAARRRAQLDELRQRRMGRQGGAVPPTIPPQAPMQRPGQFSPPGQVVRPQQPPAVLRPQAPPQPPRQRAHEIRQIDANAAAWRRQQELEARRRREELARKQAEEKAAIEREAAEAARLQAQHAARTHARAARRSGIREIVATAPGADVSTRAVGLAAAGVSLASLADSIRSPEQIRRAIILKEILDQPISLRTVDKPL